MEISFFSHSTLHFSPSTHYMAHICCYGFDQSPNSSWWWVSLWSGRQVWMKAPRWETRWMSSMISIRAHAQVLSLICLHRCIHVNTCNQQYTHWCDIRSFPKPSELPCCQWITLRAAYSNSALQTTYSSLTHWNTTLGVRHIQLSAQFYIHCIWNTG